MSLDHDADVTLRPAAGRLDYLEDLLDRCGLPTADVRSKPDCLYVAVRDGDPVGAGGLEVHGGAALLRSVAVEPAARGEGVGTAVCDALETRAAEADAGTVYLLTTTAADFFADRGYERVDRDAAPPGIRSTTEFETLCPDDATVMRRHV